jgi:Pentapeptide repeats (8 copies)
MNPIDNDATSDVSRVGVSPRSQRHRQRVIAGIVAAVVILFGVFAFAASNNGKETAGTLIRGDCEFDPAPGLTVSCAGTSSSVRDIGGVDLPGRNLAFANLSFTRLFHFGAPLNTPADLRGAILIQANLNGATLVKTRLRGAILIDATLTNATLTSADLRGANLTGADLTGADLTSVRWQRTICPDGTLNIGTTACTAQQLVPS